ncbi:hypothetical protein M0802_008248 [Mischocyttarus mexicanus]|nr:hypothetical protein M0802_008248 [Mischocyttarus mexicanus]
MIINANDFAGNRFAIVVVPKSNQLTEKGGYKIGTLAIPCPIFLTDNNEGWCKEGLKEKLDLKCPCLKVGCNETTTTTTTRRAPRG